MAHDIGLRPCPETCAYEITEFEPAGVPDATGVQAIATQESIDEIGDDIQPDARYSVYFADGPIAYEVTMFGPPDEVSRQQVEDIAAALYAARQGRALARAFLTRPLRPASWFRHHAQRPKALSSSRRQCHPGDRRLARAAFRALIRPVPHPVEDGENDCQSGGQQEQERQARVGEVDHDKVVQGDRRQDQH